MGKPEILAAVDLGSNSFHMIVARREGHHLRILDRLREPVRLAEGLEASRKLSDAARQRALACLDRFGQRLRAVDAGGVRAVGTNTLRRARRTEAFLRQAEAALGHGIEVIPGYEEARLVYLGVARSLDFDDRPRLVVDIGGGSTELIIGTGMRPRAMDSLHMGCVSFTERYFANGAITGKKMEKALVAAGVELEPVAAHYQTPVWAEAVGASGTVRSIASVLQAQGWCDYGITREGLQRLGDALLEAGRVDRLQLAGLSEDRRPVLPGGFVVLSAVFESLGVNRMEVAEGALREGLLHDLLGRMGEADVRSATVDSLARRYHVDELQAERVAATAHFCLEQVAEAWSLQSPPWARQLRWAAQLHEVGLDISHSQYHKHGAYITRHADMAGFSSLDQQLLATLVRAHRRKFPIREFNALPGPHRIPLMRLGALLRLAVLLHRSRSDSPLPEFRLTAEGQHLKLALPGEWLEQHPLVRADLEAEQHWLKRGGVLLHTGD
ncbi:exopolyphosphatase/guanosine-5'-triphosphate,3'-diphosphate pyrophosphatase [Alkalispirillum mobile]|uniref:Exopolyphosphatase n=1 Tax=Alkalispirillum mobile TaxID=85925 RepID=A0A498C3M7_9GAMM|nr:exopolyphosphatase [Alkalispirillum mobile]RLK50734.1 exopolyphosphatase/guanosine-5'-triphosphate,3'-diphosphate pyrophosphatase [Alkalispirillum mobile]